MPVFFGGPDCHYVKPEDDWWPPLCGFSGAELYTNDESKVTCRDCAAILGTVPADMPEAEEDLP